MNTIYLVYRGSRAHGTSVSDIDDVDRIGACIADKSAYLGFKHFEQKETFEGENDTVIYEIRKFCRLLLQSNPNVLSSLWVTEDDVLDIAPGWVWLYRDRELFSSKRVYQSFCGYARSQQKKMQRVDYEGYSASKRAEMRRTHGYDTKHAGHLIRLLRMGCEFLETGVLHVRRSDAQELIDIKLGKWSLEKITREAEQLYARAERAYEKTVLPNEPQHEEVERRLIAGLEHELLSRFA